MKRNVYEITNAGKEFLDLLKLSMQEFTEVILFVYMFAKSDKSIIYYML